MSIAGMPGGVPMMSESVRDMIADIGTHAAHMTMEQFRAWLSRWAANWMCSDDLCPCREVEASECNENSKYGPCDTCHRPLTEDSWFESAGDWQRHLDAADCVRATARRCAEIARQHADTVGPGIPVGPAAKASDEIRNEYGIPLVEIVSGGNGI